jgi:hypothetical protein
LEMTLGVGFAETTHPFGCGGKATRCPPGRL